MLCFHEKAKSNIYWILTLRKREKRLNRLKIGLVSSFPPTKCGIANYSAKLVEALNGLLDSRSVFVFADATDRPLEIEKSSNIVRVWRRDSSQCFLSIFGHIISKRVDIVHIQHEYLLYGGAYHGGLFPVLPLLLRLFGKKVVITMHSIMPTFFLTWPLFEKYGAGHKLVGLKRLLTIFVTRLTGIFSSKVIVHTEVARNTLIRDYGFAAEKVQVMPHGTDLQVFKFSGRDAKRQLGLDGVNVLLFFGFIHPRKGVENALRALPKILKKYPNTKFVVAGTCHGYVSSKGRAYMNYLERLSESLQLKPSVQFNKKFIPDNDLPLYFAAADIFILPYTEEGIIGASGALSMVASVGKPVVASKIYRFSDVIDGENGLLVPCGNADALAEAVIGLLADPSLRKKIGQNLRRFARRNCWKNVSRRTLALYLKLLNSAERTTVKS
jgi:glycosyltransferase involved in cell wall biosynthesis